jgi:hypothetical protein
MAYFYSLKDKRKYLILGIEEKFEIPKGYDKSLPDGSKEYRVFYEDSYGKVDYTKTWIDNGKKFQDLSSVGKGVLSFISELKKQQSKK